MENKINESLEINERAEQLKTVLNNRIGFCRMDLERKHSNPDIVIGRIQAYKDCLQAINKEFFELSAPVDNFFEEFIKKYKNWIVEEVNPIEKYRGSPRYMEEMKLNGRIADMLEEICMYMYQNGYRRGTIENKEK